MTRQEKKRSYRSALRTEQAAQTRRRVLEAAAACFAESGYAGTSLPEIAARAEVSPETVKANGPKRGLLLNAFEQAFAGAEGEGGIAESEAGARIAGIADGQAMLIEVAAFVASANARTSILWGEFMSAANADEKIEEALNGLLERRALDYKALVEALVERGVASGSTDIRTAAATLSFLWSPEGHQQLVLQSGWGQERYTSWLADAARLHLQDTAGATRG